MLISSLICLWFMCGAAAILIASSKGRGGCGWELLGFLFGPLSLLALIVSPPNRPALEKRELETRLRNTGMRQCPKCATLISKEATVCVSCEASVKPLRTRRRRMADAIKKMSRPKQ